MKKVRVGLLWIAGCLASLEGVRADEGVEAGQNAAAANGSTTATAVPAPAPPTTPSPAAAARRKPSSRPTNVAPPVANFAPPPANGDRKATPAAPVTAPQPAAPRPTQQAVPQVQPAQNVVVPPAPGTPPVYDATTSAGGTPYCPQVCQPQCQPMCRPACCAPQCQVQSCAPACRPQPYAAACAPVCASTCPASCGPPSFCGTKATNCATANSCGGQNACGGPAECGQTSCDPCGANVFANDCCDSFESFGGTVNFVFLRREHIHDSPIFVDAAGGTLLNGADFDMRRHPGIEASLWSALDSETRLTGRFLWLDSMTDRLLITVPATAGLATNPPGVRGVTTTDVLRYQSQLQSADVGVRQSANDFLQLGAGFRYVAFDERLRDDFNGGGLTGFHQFVTKNDLFGVQATGNLALLEFDGLQFDAFGAAGVYYNHIDSTVSSASGAAGPFRFGDTAGDVAFVGELGLNMVGKVTEGLSVSLGYRLLFLEGVALAPDQVSRTTNINAAGPQSTSVDSDGGAFLHGMTVGVQWQY